MAFLKYLSQELHSRKRAPSFFREEGVKKIDIDFGYYIERPEEHKIIYSIFKYKHHIITGMPASGKTSLARKIGYILEKQGNFHVVILDAGDITQSTVEEIISEVSETQLSFRESLFIIVDDIHRSFEYANDVLLHILSLGINSLFSSRPSFRHYIDVKRTNVLIELERRGDAYITELSGNDIQEELIKKISKSFSTFPDKEQIDELKQLSHGDLWVFGRLLNTYDNTGEFDIQNLYDKIIFDLRKLENTHNLAISSCVHELSLYGKYEIPVLKNYFSEKYSEEIVRTLTNEYLIFQKSDHLYFYHSSIADLYNNSLNKDTEKHTTISNSLSSYLDKNITESSNVFLRLGLFPKDAEFILENNDIINLISKYMSSNQTSILECADLITNLCRLGTEKTAQYVTQALQNITNCIIEKVNNETSIGEIVYFLNSIPWFPKDGGHKKEQEINKTVSRAIFTENNSEKCMYQIPASKITKKIALHNKNTTMVGCSRYIDRDGAFYCRKSSTCMPSETNKEIIRNIDRNILKDKINSTDDIFRSALLLNLLYWVDQNVAKEIFIKSKIREKTNTTEDREKYGYITDVLNMF